MKRFLVFAFDDYYPSGGLWDVNAAFDEAEEALAFARKIHDTKSTGGRASTDRLNVNVQVLDRVEGKVIYPEGFEL